MSLLRNIQIMGKKHDIKLEDCCTKNIQYTWHDLISLIFMLNNRKNNIRIFK
jgi:hypothetical protein